MTTKWMCIALVFGWRTVPTAFAQTPDVNGIKLGMTLDEAKSKIGSGYEIQINKFPDPAIVMLSASTPRTAAAGDGWVIQAINGKVAYINHQRYFPNGSQPERGAAMKGLEQKYGGPPTDVPSGTPEWMYEAGKLVPPKPVAALHACLGYQDWAPSPQVIMTDHGASGSPMSYITGFRSHCPVHVYVRLQGDQLLTGIDVMLFDEPAFYAEAAQVARAKDAQKQQSIEKGKQVKTPF